MGIEISHLQRRFHQSIALDDVSLSIADGEFVALLGPSGSGKTSLLRILAGLDLPDAGSVERDGEDLLVLDARRRGVGLVFQHYALFPHMTVAQNVAFGLRVRPWRQRPRASAIKQRVEELLRRVELEHLSARYPAQLSGGQRQRVALARALAIQPRLLLLDEPFGALDAQVRVTLRRWLREFHRSLGITTLFVTHDQDEALEMADRVVVMNDGRIEQIGTPQDIHRHPATPFVSRFIARGQAIPVEVANGTLRALGRAWPIGGLADERIASIALHIRPQDIFPTQFHREGWQARVLNVRRVAGAVRVSLLLPGVEEPLEAEWNERELLGQAMAAGDAIDVQIQSLTVYGCDAQGRVVASKAFQPPQGASPITLGSWRRLEA
ncbi:MAG TPA: sulfate/molybdate ABC transporter ATP-binding protein [Dyella sp.]|uniref:sulfate/molybdate ABC transporter ATP-binding protein n=1 Tax=Dyella sp. TaxID=1869338 RepID=UPI002C8E1C5F|nr:sulfate/molybdate ABC transporter ATP-binding protein [Dyella sp.]HTV85205.1 sulfate/molybdate ABC transporter ATP-binding protein [Dyella sp.]